MKSLPRSRDQNQVGWARRFGRLADHGIVAVPSLLFRFQGALGLSPEETWFITFVLSYKWDERDPYPSLREISKLSGVPRTTLVRYKDSLVRKGLLRIRRRRQPRGGYASHQYDFSPLFERMERILDHLQSWGYVHRLEEGKGQSPTEDSRRVCPPVDIPMSTSGPEEEAYKEEKKKNKHIPLPTSNVGSRYKSPQEAADPAPDADADADACHPYIYAHAPQEGVGTYNLKEGLEKIGLEGQPLRWLLANVEPLELWAALHLAKERDGQLGPGLGLRSIPGWIFKGFQDGWLRGKARDWLRSKGFHRCRSCGEWTDSIIDGLCSECYWGGESYHSS